MPKLDEVRKSILFAEGMSDDSDRFLLEPPAVEYSENLRMEKTGSLQKRPGFDALTTVPNPMGDPFFVSSIGDGLFTLTKNGTRYWNGTEWREQDFPGFFGSSAVEAETPSVDGMTAVSHFLWRPPAGEPQHVFAYEVTESPTQFDSPTGQIKHIIVRWHSLDGQNQQQYKIMNARSPRIVGGAAFPALFYQEAGTGELYGALIAPGIAPAGFGLGPQVAADPPVAAIGPTEDTGDGNRLGQGVRGQARYQVVWSETASKYVVLWTEESNGGVKLQRFGSDIQLDGAAITVLSEETGDILALSEFFPHVVVLVQHFNITEAPVGYHRMGVARYQISDLSVQGVKWIDEGTEPDLSLNNNPSYSVSTYTHGAIGDKLVGINHVSLIAVHDSGPNSYSVHGPDGLEQVNGYRMFENRVRHADQGVKFYEYSWVTDTLTETHRLPGHRVVSDVVDYEDSWLVAVQQWIDHTPQIDFWGIADYVSVLPSKKTLSTVLCAFQKDELPRPVAVLDSNVSKFCDYAESEIAIHMQSLQVDGDDLVLLNRIAVRPEDTSLFIGATVFSVVRTVQTIVPGEAIARAHRIKPATPEEVSAAELGDGSVLPFAVPMLFDGNLIAEFAPLESPEIVQVYDAAYADRASQVANFPTNPMVYEINPAMSGGPYPGDATTWRKMAAVIGYVDFRGNTHRSAPSSTVYVQGIEEGGSRNDDPYIGENTFVAVTPPLSLLGAEHEYFCEIYASNGPDTDMQLVYSFPIERKPLQNMPGATINLNVATAFSSDPVEPVRRTTPPVYTDGDVLAADPWPTFKNAVATSTRFWAIDSANPGRVAYSKLFEDYIAPEYNATLAINLGDERTLTAIGKLDDKVVVFEPNDIHVIYGEGPDNRGQGQDFAVHYITTDVGCRDQQSVIETPMGLMFYSAPRGFYLLDRNLQIQFVGAAVEDLARGINVVAATLDPREGEVRFLVEPDPASVQNTRDGPAADTTAVTRPPSPSFGNELPADACLSFQYEKGQWLLYTNYEGRAATLYQRKYTRLLSDWSVWQESETDYGDPVGSNRTLLRSPWIRLSENVQSFQRLWRITFLGRYLSSLRDLGGGVYEAGDIVVRLYFDYEKDFAQEERFRMQDFGFDPFDSPRGRAERLQFEVFPCRGRCQAVQVEIEEVPTEDLGQGLTYGLGAGFEIVSADLSIGVSPMRALLPQAVKG